MSGGYDAAEDTDDSVYQRLADIWEAETKDYNLTYVSTTVSFAGGHAADPAALGGPDQSGGNCIETDASVRRRGRSPRPGRRHHPDPGPRVRGISVDDTNQTYYFIETTMIGQATFDEAGQVGLTSGTTPRPRPADETGVRLGGRSDGRARRHHADSLALAVASAGPRRRPRPARSGKRELVGSGQSRTSGRPRGVARLRGPATQRRVTT